MCFAVLLPNSCADNTNGLSDIHKVVLCFFQNKTTEGK